LASHFDVSIEVMGYRLINPGILAAQAGEGQTCVMLRIDGDGERWFGRMGQARHRIRWPAG
jgi:hypothetical protein